MQSLPIVVYIHGALSSKRSFSFIEAALHHQPTGGFLEKYHPYKLELEPVQEIIDRLTASLGRWSRQHRTQNFLLIGHSFGGVIAVAAARALLESGLNLQVLTLATPFRGSDISFPVRFFHPGSLFFKNIGSSESFFRRFTAEPLPCRTLSFVTVAGGVPWIHEENDGVVSVASQLHFKNDPLSKHHLVNVNHFEILLHELVSRHAATLLTTGFPPLQGDQPGRQFPDKLLVDD